MAHQLTMYIVLIFFGVIVYYAITAHSWYDLTLTDNTRTIQAKKVNSSLSTESIQKIYFLETAGVTKLNDRQLCTIESALRLNPKSRVSLLHLNPDFDTETTFKGLHIFANLITSHLNMSEFVHNLPIKDLVENITRDQYWSKVNDISDIARVALLFANGGSYYDLDIIFTKPLPPWRNCLHYETKKGKLTNAAFSGFDKGHPIFEYMFNLQTKRWKKATWGSVGVNIVKPAADEFDSENERKVCRLSNDYFFYTKWDSARKEFWPAKNQSEYYWRSIVPHNSTGIHIFNKVTNNLPLANNNNIYSYYGCRFCPQVMSSYACDKSQ